jgi:hypothetical protein
MRRDGYRVELSVLWAFVVVAVGITSVRAAETAGKSESWQAIYMSGQRVGFAHIESEEIERDGKKVTVSDTLSQMTIKRFGISLKMSVQQTSEEDADGNLLGFRFLIDNPPVSNVDSRGVVKDDKLSVTTMSAGKEKVSTQPWDPNVKSPAWIERILTVEPLKEGQSREFSMFDPQFMKAAKITITHRGKAQTKLLDGSLKEFEKVETRHSLVPGLVTTSYADESGQTVKTEANLLQTVMYTVSKEEALKEVSGEELDLGMDTVVKTGKIPNVHTSKTGVYKVTVDGNAAESLPAGPTQSIKSLSDTEIELTVKSITPGEKGDEPAPGEAYVKSSRFLDTEDANVKALAVEGAAGETDHVKLAVGLELFVSKRLANKNFSTALATASEVARDLSGDCTEHAVLLAALLRANGVPSRVAIGFVYADSIGGFGGHMWTEAYVNGRWVPLDATLGLGGIGVGHIKVADADLSENSAAPVGAFVPIVHLLGKMQVSPVTVE